VGPGGELVGVVGGSGSKGLNRRVGEKMSGQVPVGYGVRGNEAVHKLDVDGAR